MRSQRQLKRLQAKRRTGRLQNQERFLRYSYRGCKGQRRMQDRWHYEYARWQEHCFAWDAAIQQLKCALYFNPHKPDAWYRLGLLYEVKNELGHSLQAFSKYLQEGKPGSFSAHFYLRMARLLERSHKPRSALAFYVSALESADRLEPELLFHLAQALDNLDEVEVAMDCLILLGKSMPAYLDFIAFFMGSFLEKKGYYVQACQCFDEAIQRRPKYVFWQLKRQLTYPLVMDSASQVLAFRQQFEAALQHFLQHLQMQPIQLAPENLFLIANFQSNLAYLAYHHVPTRRLRELVAHMTVRLVKMPPKYAPARRTAERVHLGLLVSGGSLGMGYIYVGAMAEQLDPNRFQVTLFCTSREIEKLFNEAEYYAFDQGATHVKYEVISADVYQGAQQVRDAQVDVMFFTEPTWDFYQHMLTLFRVAPVQMTSWMNPGTSGLSAMDYFYSCEAIEQGAGQENYTETLIAQKEFPSYVPSVHLPKPVDRSYFGLEPGWHLYGCLQNLLKFHPDFDAVVAQILRQDPDGHLILINPKNAHLAQEITRRLTRKMPDLMERIWFFPALSNQDFLRLLQCMDVILDPIYYGGGTTTYQALACGIPIITWPTDRMVGQITAALCRAVNYPEGVVNSLDEYIARAVQVASQPLFRQQLQQQILASGLPIFECKAAVRQFEDILMSLYAQHCLT